MPCGEHVAIRLSLFLANRSDQELKRGWQSLHPMDAQFYHSENTCGNPEGDYALVAGNEFNGWNVGTVFHANIR